MDKKLPDYVTLDIETARLLVLDFFSVPTRAKYVGRTLPHINKEITRRGFTTAKLKKHGPDSPAFRMIAEILTKDPMSAAIMAHIVHDSNPDDAPKLGPKRVEKIARERGGLAALWAALATAFFHKKSSAAGFARAAELAREAARVQAQASSVEDSAGENDKSAESEIKHLKKELKQTKKRLDQAVAAAEAWEKKLTNLKEERRRERDAAVEAQARLAEAQALVLDERARLADEQAGRVAAEARVGEMEILAAGAAPEREVLRNERASLEREREALDSDREALESQREVLESERAAIVAQRDILALERDSLAALSESLERDLMSAKVEAPPRLELDAVRDILIDKLRQTAAAQAFNAQSVGALAGAIEHLDKVITLERAGAVADHVAQPELEASPEVPCSERGAPANAQERLAETQERPADTQERRMTMSRAEISAWDDHNAHKTIEEAEALIMRCGRPAKLLLDAHNIIRRNGFSSDSQGRESLKEMAPLIAERTGAQVYVVFDTRYETDMDYGPNCRYIYASKADGKADARISEEAWVPCDRSVVIFSDDLKDVVADAHEAAGAGHQVFTLETRVMAEYVRALAVRDRGGR